uniref:Uncharacterized protein n=1 Tax=Panagrolaimus davidi TaxID=227884 RepID=A0A914PQT8_9BILA
MFEELKQKLCGDLGFACMCLDTGKTEHRKSIIESGLAAGFIEVSVMSKFEACFYFAICKYDGKMNEGDIVWLIDTWDCCAFQKINGKPRMIDFSTVFYREHPFSDKHLELKIRDFNNAGFARHQPNMIFYQFRKLTLTFKNVPCIPTSFERGKSALAKARMMAGDPEVMDLNVLPTLFADIKIEFEGNFLHTIPRCTLLPYEKTIKIERKSSDQFFEVLEDDPDPEASKKYAKFNLANSNNLITIKINESSVYTIEQSQSLE